MNTKDSGWRTCLSCGLEVEATSVGDDPQWNHARTHREENADAAAELIERWLVEKSSSVNGDSTEMLREALALLQKRIAWVRRRLSVTP